MKIRDAGIVVTGSSSGIGLALSEALVENGGNVIGLSRRKTLIPAGAGGGRFRSFQADLSLPEDIAEAFRRIQEEGPPVDVLVNNAGWGEFGDMENLPRESWEGMLSVNLAAPFFAIQEVVSAMKERRRGMIINVASIAGKRGIKGAAAYCATKFGLVGLSASLKEEFREYGIRVSCICPGAVDTPFFDTTSIQPEKRMDTKAVVDAIIAAIVADDDVLHEEVIICPL